MIKNTIGDLLDIKQPIIIGHQVNCLGIMGAGIAKSIKSKWFNVFTEYTKFCNKFVSDKDLLGKCQLVPVDDENIKYVANLFGEYSFAEAVAPFEGNRHTDYEALEAALRSFKAQAIEKGFKDIGVPYKLGCGLAGGDWDGVVYPMLQKIFSDNSITLWIVKLPTA